MVCAAAAGPPAWFLGRCHATLFGLVRCGQAAVALAILCSCRLGTSSPPACWQAPARCKVFQRSSHASITPSWTRISVSRVAALRDSRKKMSRHLEIIIQGLNGREAVPVKGTRLCWCNCMKSLAPSAGTCLQGVRCSTHMAAEKAGLAAISGALVHSLWQPAAHQAQGSLPLPLPLHCSL